MILEGSITDLPEAIEKHSASESSPNRKRNSCTVSIPLFFMPLHYWSVFA
jgi:hypothetical protein